MADVIEVEYRANVTGFKAQLKDAESTLTKVEATAKDSAQKTEQHFQKAGDGIKDTAKEIGKVLLEAFAVEKVLEFGKESIKAFSEIETQTNKLKFAVTKIGGEGSLAFNKLVEQAEKLGKTTIFSTKNIEGSQAQLANFGLTSKQIEKLLPQIIDMASATGEDLASATDKAIQGINGQTRSLKEVGITYADTGSKTQNLAILTEKLSKFQGAAGDAALTTAGKTARLANAYESLQESVGKYLVGAGNELLNTFDVLFGKTTLADQSFNRIAEIQIDTQKKANDKILEDAEKSEGERLKLLAESSRRIIIFTNDVINSKSLAEQRASQIFLDGEKKLNNELRNLNKESDKVRDDATLAGQAAAKSAAEAKLKAQQDALKDLKDFDKKSADDVLQAQAQTDLQKLELTRDNSLKELAIKVEAARKAGVEENKILQSNNADTTAIFEKFNIDKKVLDDKQNEKDFADAIAFTDKLTDAEVKAGAEKQKKLLEQEKKAAEEQKKLRKELTDTIGKLIDDISVVSKRNSDEQIQNIEDQNSQDIDSFKYALDHKQISQQQYDAKVAQLQKQKENQERQIKKEQFEKDKALSIIKIIIATAQAVITQFAETGYAGAILAGVVGAAELAVVASQPTPKFERGGKIKGKRHSAGGTLIEAEDNEWVIKRNEAMKHDRLLSAVNSGGAEKFIHDFYIAPALKAQQKQLLQQKEKLFASNLADSMSLNFKDGNILESLKDIRKKDRENTIFLGKKIEQISNNVNWKR